MKPTASMRQRVALAARDTGEAAEAPKPDPAFVAERRRQAVRALEQTQKEIVEGSVKKAADEALGESERSLSGSPNPDDPDVIVARVIGFPGKGEPAVPLHGMPVRLMVDRKAVAETKSDLFGLARIPLPKEGKEGIGAYELEAVSPEGGTLASQTGSARPGDSPVHVLEIARTDALAPIFERAEPWRKGLLEARARRDAAVNAVDLALAEQEKQLVALIAELDKALF